MRTQFRSRVSTRSRAVAGLAALVLPLAIMAASGAPAQASAAPGSPIEVFVSPGFSNDPGAAIQHGWWGHEGAPSGTGTGTSFLDIDAGDPDLSIFPDLSNVRVAFVTTSGDGSAEHPVATAGQTVGQVFGAGSWFMNKSIGSGLNGNANPNDSVTTVSTPAEYTGWFQNGQPLQAYDSALVAHDVAPGDPVAAKPQGKSILNRWPAGSHISLVYYLSTGAIDPTTGLPIVDVGSDGHAVTAYMPFTTVAKGDGVRSSAGYTDEGIQAVSTTTTLTATPASPQVVGTAVSLDATVTATSGTASGSVEFFDGATSLGTAAVNGSGHAATSGVNLPEGTHQLKAVYTPTGNFSGSQSVPQAYQITARPVVATHTALAAVAGASYTAPVALTATVTDDDDPQTCPAGSVAFKDGAATVETVNAPTSSPCTFEVSHTFASPGAHNLTAVFTPADLTSYGISTSASVPVDLPVGDCTTCVDVQTITGNIPAGTLTITTPYTPASPLNLGDLALTSDLKQYTASAPFEDIHLLDTRAGAQPWTLSALASALANGGNSINGQNVGLTGLATDSAFDNGNPFVQQLGLGAVTVTDVPAADPAVAPADAGSAGLGGAPKTILQDTQGPADVMYHGTLTLNAPTTTSPGLYTGTITFTAS